MILEITGSFVTIAPVPYEQHATAEAIVTFDNNESNSTLDNKEYFLTLNDLVVPFTFTFNSDAAGADSITVTPPDGMICVPSCTITLLEGYSDHIFLIPYQGM